MGKYALAVLLLACLLFGTAMAGGDMKVLIADRCLSCHDMEKVCVVKSNDVKWWKDSVQRMVDYQKDLLTAGEVDAMGAFLAVEANRNMVCAK